MLYVNFSGFNYGDRLEITETTHAINLYFQNLNHELILARPPLKLGRTGKLFCPSMGIKYIRKRGAINLHGNKAFSTYGKR